SARRRPPAGGAGALRRRSDRRHAAGRDRIAASAPRHPRRLQTNGERLAHRAGGEAKCDLSRGLPMNFDELRQQYDIVPVVRELAADTLTPLAAFAALSPDDAEAFLFESVERGENLGRYSFIGFEPRRSLRFDRDTPDPAGLLNAELRPLRVYNEDKLPPFFGGAVGFFGYGVAGWSERIP